MIRLTNSDFKVASGIDLFVASFGYEERSFHIYSEIKEQLNIDNTFIISINDYDKYDRAKMEISSLNENNYKVLIVSYEDSEKVQNSIIQKVEEIQKDKEKISIFIDYSSMPRGWYCRLPELFDQILRAEDEVTFWYSEGNYSQKPNEVFPTAGVESYILYSGSPSIQSRKGRSHIIGIGYDAIRTMGILSILDPEYSAVLEAYDPEDKQVYDNIKEANVGIIEQANIAISLYINDIEFMIAKIKGLVNELYEISDNNVILVPDGPKPLIFAMSMVPWLINKEGISCIHILRNNQTFKPKDVTASGKVVGFKIMKDE